MSLHLKCVACKWHTVGSFFFIQSDNLCLLIGDFSPFTFNVIITMMGIRFTILLFFFFCCCSSVLPTIFFFFLGLWVCVFLSNLENFCHYFFKYFSAPFSLSSPGITILCMLDLRILSYKSLKFYSFFQSFFSLSSLDWICSLQIQWIFYFRYCIFLAYNFNF